MAARGFLANLGMFAGHSDTTNEVLQDLGLIIAFMVV